MAMNSRKKMYEKIITKCPDNNQNVSYFSFWKMIIKNYIFTESNGDEKYEEWNVKSNPILKKIHIFMLR